MAVKLLYIYCDGLNIYIYIYIYIYILTLLSLFLYVCVFQVAEQLMTIAYESGVNLFDTAEVYAAGK